MALCQTLLFQTIVHLSKFSVLGVGDFSSSLTTIITANVQTPTGDEKANPDTELHFQEV